MLRLYVVPVARALFVFIETLLFERVNSFNDSLCFHSKLQLYLKPGSQVHWKQLQYQKEKKETRF